VAIVIYVPTLVSPEIPKRPPKQIIKC